MKIKSMSIVLLSLFLFGCDSLSPDTEKPQITKVKADGSSIVIEATDNRKIDVYLVTSDETTPNSESADWQSSSRFDYTGSGRYYVWAKDKAGNISELSENSLLVVAKALPYAITQAMFTQGLVPVLDPDYFQWGYIDMLGQYVIEPQYDSAGSFQGNGLAVVEKYQKYLVINTENEVILEEFENKLAITDNGLIYETNTGNIYDSTGVLVYILPEPIDGYSDNQWYKSGCTYYKETGEIMLEITNGTTCHNFVNGLAFIQESGSYGEWDENYMVGRYVDTTGVSVIEHFETPTYSQNLGGNRASLPVFGLGGSWESFYFSDPGTAVMRSSDGLLGYVDRTGNWVIQPKFDKAGSFNEFGIAIVATTDDSGVTRYGLIDKTGAYVLTPRHQVIGTFYTDVAVYLGADGKIGFIGTDGKPAFDNQYAWSSAISFLEDGYSRVKNKEGRWGIINKLGYLIIDFKYYDIR